MAKKPPTFAATAVAGLPTTAAKFLRVDYREDDFDLQIETKCPRIAWTRAVICPCVGFSLDNSTSQPSPNCPYCSGLGHRYFRPSGYVYPKGALGTLDLVQTEIVSRMNAVVIRGLLTGIAHHADIFQALGSWAFGSAMITVRAQNKLGYYDRLCQLDEVATYTEIAIANGTTTLPTKYPCVQLNYISALETEYLASDVKITAGAVTFKTTPPPNGTRIAVHYLYHPVWAVVEHTNLLRTSILANRRDDLLTPAGDTLQLPIRALIRLEHLPLDMRGAA